MAGTDSAFFQRLVIAGGGLDNMGIGSETLLLSAQFEQTVDQVSELSFDMHDPNWAYALSFGEKGPLEKEAQYADLPLVVAAYSIGPGQAGNGGTTIKLRPRAPEKMRKIVGALTRENLSPSQFVADSAINCGAKWVVQDSPARPSISRDVGSEDANQPDSNKNELTTNQRLAAEEGFLFFEVRNTIYFGSPQWLFDTRPNHVFGLGNGSVKDAAHQLESVPTIDVSMSKDTTNEVSFSLPLTLANEVIPGHSCNIVGLPGTMNNKKLLITRTSFPIAGPGSLEITARDPWVIEKQKTPEQLAAEQAAANAANSGGDGGGGGAGNGATGPGPDLRNVTTAGAGGLTPAATALRKDIMARFGVSDIGGYRPADGYGEHSTGRALDVMIGSDRAKGTAIKNYCIDNAVNFGLKWCIWEQALWYPGGRRSGMEDRGSATQNHFDHVHIFLAQ